MVKVVGLTGGIASGKSTVATLLRERGAAIVDADLLAREVVARGQPALGELVVRFGPAILTADGALDRKALGARVFADPAARADLNRITHPRIAAAAQAAIAAHAAAGVPVVFYEAALLIENGLHRGLDGTIVVSVDPATQAARLAARDNLPPDAVEGRLAAQLPLADKLAVATWVVDNSGDRAALTSAVDRLWHSLEARFGPLAVAPPDSPVEDVLVTGWPSAVAIGLCAELLARDPAATVCALVPDDGAAAAPTAGWPEAIRARFRYLVGDVAAMDLGLSTREYLALRARVTTIHHAAALVTRGGDARQRSRDRVAGTRSVLDLAAEAPRLRRVVHWSSLRAIGDRRGVVREAPLPTPPRFARADDRAAYDAERAAVGAMARLPVTVLRVADVVGDAVDGKADVATALFRLVARAGSLQLPLPGDGLGPLQVLPVAYVVAAAATLGAHPRAAGRVMHLVDPDPPTVRAALDRVADLAGRDPWRGSIPRPLARAILRTPGFERMAQLPAAMLALVSSSNARLDASDTHTLLTAAGLPCPRFDDWIGAVIALAPGDGAEAEPALDDDTQDPLA
ncbi:MAG: dephospho-CoA kinase [Myxococcales bacterium]|nr:dephospho-CoA kinase [Myxococcales bacterium]MBK7194563.1 dephospho-CoA kinase [Myxococcales bacterium]MBP6845184.1 dephospho-CoA kinase [Kofleriaceae bacterium]